MTSEKKAHIKRETAFALGGLGGNNGFGAGFLQQALDEKVEPQIITCTSGQVYWVAEYLSCLRNGKTLSGGTSIEQIFRENIDEQTPYGLFLQELKKHFDLTAPAELAALKPFMVSFSETLPFSRDMVSAWIALHGKDERFRMLPLQDWLAEFLTNSYSTGVDVAWHTFSGTLGSVFLTKECANTVPGRLLKPLFKDEFMAMISQKFLDEDKLDNDKGIGIVFNSYDATKGEEHIYANKHAQRLLKIDMNNPKGDSHWRKEVVYNDIDKTEAVRASLWLYQYGFSEDKKQTDGAYYRDVMLGEACAGEIRKIYSVRPISTNWIDKLPKTYIELEDYKTEVAFNGMFAGERDKMNLIRKVSDDFETIVKKCFDAGKPIPEEIAQYFANRYPPIEVIRIEPRERNRGYYDYVFEDIAFFQEGKTLAKNKFTA